jgi:hypothetical protein
MSKQDGVEVREFESGRVYCVDGPWIDKGFTNPASFGIPHEQLGACATRGELTKLAQFIKIVAPGLVTAQHIFRGLKRPLFAHNNPRADEAKLVYSWSPTSDYEWRGGRQGRPKSLGPLPGRVFVVIVTPNDTNKFSEITGWIERWTWVLESRTLTNAPDNHETRYERKLWSAS